MGTGPKRRLLPIARSLGGFSTLLMLGAAILAARETAAWSQNSASAPPPVPCRFDRIKNPASWFSWGADVRLRHDSGENPYLTHADPPGHTYSFERLRLREWNAFKLHDACQLNLRFTWEDRHYWAPGSKDEWYKSEVAFDNLNAKGRVRGLPLTVTLGRQDIVFGDGWLVSDGTPLDGPRTTWFDAVRATVELPSIKGTLEVIYIDQTTLADRWLHPLFSQNVSLMEQDERGAIVYVASNCSERTPVDAYFIHKRDVAVLSNGDTGEVNAVGGRVARVFGKRLSGRIESVYQGGNRRNAVMLPGHEDRLSAWGLNGRLTCSTGESSTSSAWLGCEILSGHDADDPGNHQFDPLWGRWAQYSELFPNDLDRPADRSNLKRLNVGYEVAPSGGTLIQINYHAIFTYAHRNAGTPGFSERGNVKGHLFTALVRRKFNRYWSGLMLGEYFLTGNYYAVRGPLDSRTDPAAFLRCQVVFTF